MLVKHMQHFNSYYDVQNHVCQLCSQLLEVVTKRHMIRCCDVNCPIKMCQMNQWQQHHYTTSAAKLQLALNTKKLRRKPRRARDFSSRVLIQGGSYTALSRLLDYSLISSIITKKADEILDRLDKEEPLLSSITQQPSLLTQQSKTIQGSEIKHVSKLQEQLQQSEKMEGPEQEVQSKMIQEFEQQEKPQTAYPKQKLLHQLKSVSVQGWIWEEGAVFGCSIWLDS